MKTIGDLWKESGEEKGIKVRWKDWGHHHSYFVIEEFDSERGLFFGTLDNGEKAKYKTSSRHWKLYEDGDENSAKAV